MDYKETLNLPRTTFPMKANLPKLEPDMLARWDEMDIYARIRQASAKRPLWILHDGPPYANGHIHMGHVLNKVLKKAISVGKRVRSETGIAANAVSISYAAVELAKKIFQNLAGKTVLLIGAGEMAKLAARHLVQAGMQNVLITTRNYELAVDVANRFNGVPIPFSEVMRISPPSSRASTAR